VLQIAVSVGLFDLEVSVVAVQLVACRDIDVVTVKGNAAQAAISPAAFKVDFARVPVDMLLARLGLEIDREYAAMAFALLAATYDGRSDKFRQFCCHELRGMNCEFLLYRSPVRIGGNHR